MSKLSAADRHRLVVLGVLALLLPACRFTFTAPSPIVNVTNNNANTNTNNNDNDNDNRNGTPPCAANCTPTAPGTPGTPSGPRTPDPGAGLVLPLPAGAQGTILSLGQQHAALVQQCSFAFIDAILTTLRASDTRWGYVCKRGSCAEPSLDVIAYHATAGPDVTGALGTYEIDVIGNSCSALAAPQFLNYGFSAANAFSPTRQ